jgi:hypothetical protein
MSAFFGKYRGQVVNNLDPLELGRTQVRCPAVLGDGMLSWALPCVPYAGPRVGFFAIPPVGANVWVEFEGGDPDYPIWTGCFWGKATEMPLHPALPQIKVLKTESIQLTMSDVPGTGGLTLEVNAPAVSMPMKIECNGDAIALTLTAFPGSIKLSPSGIDIVLGAASIKLSPAAVNINNGALEVI